MLALFPDIKETVERTPLLFSLLSAGENFAAVSVDEGLTPELEVDGSPAGFSIDAALDDAFGVAASAGTEGVALAGESFLAPDKCRLPHVVARRGAQDEFKSDFFARIEERQLDDIDFGTRVRRRLANISTQMCDGCDGTSPWIAPFARPPLGRPGEQRTTDNFCQRTTVHRNFAG